MQKGAQSKKKVLKIPRFAKKMLSSLWKASVEGYSNPNLNSLG